MVGLLEPGHFLLLEDSFNLCLFYAPYVLLADFLIIALQGFPNLPSFVLSQG